MTQIRPTITVLCIPSATNRYLLSDWIRKNAPGVLRPQVFDTGVVYTAAGKRLNINVAHHNMSQKDRQVLAGAVYDQLEYHLTEHADHPVLILAKPKFVYQIIDNLIGGRSNTPLSTSDNVEVILLDVNTKEFLPKGKTTGFTSQLPLIEEKLDRCQSSLAKPLAYKIIVPDAAHPDHQRNGSYTTKLPNSNQGDGVGAIDLRKAMAK